MADQNNTGRMTGVAGLASVDLPIQTEYSAKRLSSWGTIKNKIKTTSSKNKTLHTLTRSKSIKKFTEYYSASNLKKSTANLKGVRGANNNINKSNAKHTQENSGESSTTNKSHKPSTTPSIPVPTISLSPAPKFATFSPGSTLHSAASEKSSSNSMSHESINSRSSTATSAERRSTSNSTTGMSRSLSKLKQRTKSILFLESPVTMANANEIFITKRRSSSKSSTPITAHFFLESSAKSSKSSKSIHTTATTVDTPSNDEKKNFLLVNEERPHYRKSISYNSNFASNKEKDEDDRSTLQIPGPRNVSNGNVNNKDDLTDEGGNSINGAHFASPAHDITRQRSKTVGALDLTGNANSFSKTSENYSTESGVFNSITNFVMMRRQHDTATAGGYSNFTNGVSSNENTVSDIVLPLKPEKQMIHDGETPTQFLDRLIEILPINQVCCALAARDNDRTKAAFKEYLNRYFSFAGESIDVSLRKFFMINELPKETQHIDRVIYEFASHYVETNRSLGFTVDICYILTYSLIMIHTDRFNPNNKRKMTKIEFIKNLSLALKTEKENQDLISKAAFSKEVMEYFYDNITYTPFAKYSTEHSDQIKQSFKDVSISLPYPSSTILTNNVTNAPITRKRSSTFLWNSLPLDPYEYLLENKLNELKPDYKHILYNPFMNINDLSGDNFDGLGDELVLMGGKKQATLEWISQNTKANIEEINTNLFNSIRKKIIDPNCTIILKVSKGKGEFLLNGKSDILRYESLDYDSKDSNEYYLTRVFEIGMMSRQESKMLTATKLWKKYFCILTTTGLLFYRNLTSFKMNYIGISAGKNVVILEENQNTKVSTSPGVLLDSFEPNFTIPINGVFASRMKKNIELDDEILNQEAYSAFSSSASASSHIVPNTNIYSNGSSGNTNTHHHTNFLVLPTSSSLSYSRRSSSANITQNSNLRSCTFFIYGKDSKDIYKVDNRYELKSWINSINYLSALDNCKVRANKPFADILYIPALIEKGGPAKYSEIYNTEHLTAQEKLAKLQASILTSKDNLLQLIYYDRFLRYMTPFSAKTRELVISVSKLASIKVQWTWFEIQRNSTFVEILKHEIKVGSLIEEEIKASVLCTSKSNTDSTNTNNTATSDSETPSSSMIIDQLPDNTTDDKESENKSKSPTDSEQDDNERSSEIERDQSASDMDEFVSAFDVSLYGDDDDD